MNKSIFFNLRYRTDPKRIQRVLPPLLEPDDEAIVLVDYALVDFDEPLRSIFMPEAYYESGFHVSAKYRGHRGMFQIGMPLNCDWGRAMGREAVGYCKKDGKINIEVKDDIIHASLWRRGFLIHRVETVVTNKPAHPLNWFREFGYGAFLYRFRLNPDWRRGPLGDGPVELWRLGGNEYGYPTEMEEGEYLPLACDIARTKFEFVDPSPLDPFCEFPLLEILGVTYHAVFWADSFQSPQRPPRPGSAPTTIAGPTSVFLETVDKAAFEPWALIGHDRPVSDGKPWCPAIWPDSATALKLTPEELEAHHSRESISLAPIDLVDIELKIDPKTHAKTLPPGCNPSNKPLVRILAIRAKASNISPVPFSELWLLSRCEINGKLAYYALSHIVGSGGDVTFGRETFGYPSKIGEVELTLHEKDFTVLGRRLGRDFFRCHANLSQPVVGSGEEKFVLLGIQVQPMKLETQVNPIKDPQAPHANLIGQPWTIHREHSSDATTESATIEFPDSPGPGIIGRPDPWFELHPYRVTRATLSQGVMSRGPGQILKDLPNFMPYFAERYDGICGDNVQQVIQMMQQGSKATFLVNRSTLSE